MMKTIYSYRLKFSTEKKIYFFSRVLCKRSVERIYISNRKNRIEMSKTKIVNFVPMPAEIFLSQLSRRTDVSNVEVVSLPQQLTEVEACQAVKDASIITTYPLAPRVTRKMLEGAEKLKLVQCTSVGYDHIDLEAATELKILVANNPGWPTTAVAEHTLMLTLMVLRSALYTYTKTVQNAWEPGEFPRFWNDMRELRSKTLGILGLGTIGKEVARLAKALGANVIYNSRRRISETNEKSLGIEYRTFKGLLEESDILSLHVPLTDETRGMIGKDEISKMKDGAFLVNTARKEVVDETAVSEALKSRKLFGFGTDFEPDFPLTGLDFVVMTPHVAGMSSEALTRNSDQVMDNIARFLDGDKPHYLVNDV
jgi:phosphoglycerate dehydrogenase-like enzyme